MASEANSGTWPLLPRPRLIGMIHVGALPGTARSRLSIPELIHQAAAEAAIYDDAGVDGILIENMHDRPYLKGRVGPEIVAAMTRVAREVRQGTDLPCGIQILAAANEEALAVALAAELQFVRVEGFVFGHVADEGWIDGCAAALLRERTRLGAEGIELWTDIKKKHSSHAMTADVSLSETARAAAYNLSDALVITGNHTGEAAPPEDLLAVKEAGSDLPVYIGSGITAENAHHYALADGFIVGSSLKRNGHWEEMLDRRRVDEFVAAVASIAGTR